MGRLKIQSFIFIIVLISLDLQSEQSNHCPVYSPPVSKEDFTSTKEILFQEFADTSKYFLKACNPLPIIDENTEQAKVDYNKKIDDSLNNRPEAGIINFNVPFYDRNREPIAKKCLNLLHENIKKEQEINKKFTEAILNCTSDTPPSDCNEINDWITNDFQALVKEARTNLALSYPKSTASKNIDSGFINIQHFKFLT